MGKLVASCLLLAALPGVKGQGPAKPQQLDAQLISLGVTHETYPFLTAAVKLTNNSPIYIFVLVFGPPHAVDDAGGEFHYAPKPSPVTGVAYCLGREGPGRPVPRSCVGKPMDEDFLFPVDQYTQIAPGKSANFNVTLRATRGSKGSKYTLTQEIAYRLVKPENIDQDQNVPDKDKLKALRFGSLDFSQVEAPPKEKVTSSISFGVVK